jgi:GntR family transcriptional regulator/MocR family aminotransferase
MHLIARLTPALSARMDDREASRRAAGAGITALALSSYYAGAPGEQGLVLGYAGFDAGLIDGAARALAKALGVSPSDPPRPRRRR